MRSAPVIGLQFWALLSQRSHCHVRRLAAFVHVPSVAVRVWPCSTVPVTVGGVLFDGGAGGAIWTAWEVEISKPPGFSACSWTSIQSPMSSAVGT